MVEMWVERVVVREDGVGVWTPQYETFDTERDFTIDDENLDGEISRIGHLLCRYGTIAAEQNANLRRKEEWVKTVEAQVSIDLRKAAEQAGTKVTEPQLKAQTIVHPKYQAALAATHVLRADSDKADHWFRSLMKKADLLHSIGFRQSAEIRRMPG